MNLELRTTGVPHLPHAFLTHAPTQAQHQGYCAYRLDLGK